MVLISLLAGCSPLFSQSDSEWDDYFMPGIAFRYYMPKDQADLGIYHGTMADFVVYARAKGSDSKKSGPARIKIYGNLSILSSDNTEANDIFYSGFGANLSFEGNADRKFLIPYFGLECGGLFQRNFSSFVYSPLAGIQLFSNKSILWSAQAGYQYTKRNFGEYSGYTLTSSFNILLWNKD